MKVGTDGILLGALAAVNAVDNSDHHPFRVLDIGCGTGLLALMMAQRTETLAANIVGIEVDPLAAKQATENASDCPWSNRITILHTSLKDYATIPSHRHAFDLILCNPPWFSGPQPLASARSAARHADSLPMEDLLVHSKTLCRDGGRLAIILPASQSNRLVHAINLSEASLDRRIEIHPKPNVPAKRILAEIRFRTAPTEATRPLPNETLTIETDFHHHYTREFQSLTQAFYLPSTFRHSQRTNIPS